MGTDRYYRALLDEISVNGYLDTLMAIYFDLTDNVSVRTNFQRMLNNKQSVDICLN